MLQQQRLPRADSFETQERFMQLGDAVQVLVRDPKRLVQFQRRIAAATLCRNSGAGTVDEQIPHDLRCKGEKMCAIRQVEAGSVNQSDVRLMNQAGRVQRVLRWRATQPLVRQLAQAFVDQGDELISGAFLSRAPTLQETRDFRLDGRRTSSAGWSPSIGVRRTSGKPREPFGATIPFQYRPRCALQPTRPDSPFRRSTCSAIRSRKDSL